MVTLFHSQVAAERRFSINNNVLTQNINTGVVIGRKAIKNHMLSSKLDATTIEIINSLLKTDGSASRKWRQVLAGKIKEKNNKN